jgi:pimeloyl-ACP methyl ester carboxylesterase
VALLAAVLVAFVALLLVDIAYGDRDFQPEPGTLEWAAASGHEPGRAIRVPNAGHLRWPDAPDRVARVVAGFLAHD